MLSGLPRSFSVFNVCTLFFFKYIDLYHHLREIYNKNARCSVEVVPLPLIAYFGQLFSWSLSYCSADIYSSPAMVSWNKANKTTKKRNGGKSQCKCSWFEPTWSMQFEFERTILSVTNADPGSLNFQWFVHYWRQHVLVVLVSKLKTKPPVCRSGKSRMI